MPRSGWTDDLADLLVSLPGGRLAILGAPGAGKSTAAAELVTRLFRRGDAGDRMPVPVLLPLASWNPAAESLGAWLARRLREDYPFLSARGRDTAERLVDANLVLPVLDGLDGLPVTARLAAAVFIGELPTFVVTCRASEFKLLAARSSPLRDVMTVQIEPAALADVMSVLAASDSSTGRRWRDVADRLAASPDSPLARALTSPATCSLILDAARGDQADPEKLLSASDPEEVSGLLLDALISSPLPYGQPARYSPQDTRRWLQFLARHLTQKGRNDIAWWRLQETTLWITALWAVLVVLLAFIAGTLGGFGGIVLALLGSIPSVRPRTPRTEQYGRPLVTRILRRPPRRSFRTLTPRGALRADLRAWLWIVIESVLAGSLGVATWALAWHPPAWQLKIASYLLGALVVLVVWLSAARTAWLRYAISCVWLGGRERLPFRLLSFLEDAQQRGLLRQVGAVYYFRQAWMQEWLSQEPDDPSRPRPPGREQDQAIKAERGESRPVRENE